MASIRKVLVATCLGVSLWGTAQAQTGTLIPQSNGGLRKLPAPPGEPIAPAAGFQAAPAPTSTEVLTGKPDAATPLPPGSYEGPWAGSRHPGNNGPITYEIETFTGPSKASAGGILSRRLNTGWTLGATGRTLMFNDTGDAAWVLGLGGSYTYNRGASTRPLDVALPRPPRTDFNGTVVERFADEANPVTIRGLHRSSFNVSVGRDWFLRGPGLVGLETEPNWRLGMDVGGKWGTAHVDLVPTADLTLYSKRGSTYHGLFTGVSVTREVNMGSWIFYSGFRLEAGYDWMNVIPPQGGDIFNLNYNFSAGIRF